MPDRADGGVDTLLARVASRLEGLRRPDRGGAAGRDEREMVADLAAIAAELRATTGALATSLAAVPDVPDARPAPLRAARRHQGGSAPREVDPLTRLAIGRGTDKWGPHFYTPVYHELFQHLRDLPIRLLEIGVGGHESAALGGASLLMWADYFPHARIAGIDVAAKRLDPHPRITILRGSQTDRTFLEQVTADHGPFDIVIDDGSHRPADVRASFETLFPAVADGGFYVVEDVQTAFWPAFGGSPDGAETMALARAALDAVNHAEIAAVHPQWVPPAMAASLRSVRAYHNLLVFEKGDNGQPSTRSFDAGNVHVAGALSTMERALERAPAPEGLAHLARTYALAGLYDEAMDAIRRGLDRWPDHVALLVAGVKVARKGPDHPLGRHCLARLAAVAAGDAALEALVRKRSTDEGAAGR